MDYCFASDNTVGAHPTVLAALVAADAGTEKSYGADSASATALEEIRRVFGDHAEAALVTTGTAANVLGLAHVLRPHEAVIAPSVAHLVNDESTAPGTFGVNLLPVPTSDGKLRPADFAPYLATVGDEHSPQPRVASITQATELGLVYSVDEVRALADAAHANGMLLHMDGARIANAVAALDVSARTAVTDAGVDLLSLGLTKIGGLEAEAIVVLKPGLSAGLTYTVKRGMQLVSKGRLIGAQVAALLADDLWLQNARHANAMAARLSTELAALPGVALARPTEASGVFVLLPPAVQAAMAKEFAFYPWQANPGEYRLMCSWKTTDAQIDAVVARAASAC